MNCACNPEKNIKCMLHFDLDGYVIQQALNEKPKLIPAPKPKPPHCNFKKCDTPGKWHLIGEDSGEIAHSCGTHITSMLREMRVNSTERISVLEMEASE